MKALGNEMKEEVKWKGKLSIDVEQKVNNDGMIRLSLHNQPVFILPYELYKMVSTKKRINFGLKGVLVLIITLLSTAR